MKGICENCGIESCTKYVKFYQNIGMIIEREEKIIEGNFCKSCIHKYFWKFSLITLFLGWWGILSFFATIAFLINNIVRYVMCLGMESVPLGVQVPQLTKKDIQKLHPMAKYILQHLYSGEDLETIIRSVSLEVGVTSGQVLLYIRVLMSEE